MSSSSQISAPRRFLPTPSARRATPFRTKFYFTTRISTHALREEGDPSSRPLASASYNFYPRPPRGGRQGRPAPGAGFAADFYPRPPRGGRHRTLWYAFSDFAISTHALREEGDNPAATIFWRTPYFYPRPPRGGRPCRPGRFSAARPDFYPRPPRGGRRGSGG